MQHLPFRLHTVELDSSADMMWPSECFFRIIISLLNDIFIAVDSFGWSRFILLLENSFPNGAHHFVMLPLR